MEPLEAAASIITLLQLMHKVTLLCLDARSCIRNATPDLLQLINEIKALCEMLENFLDLTSQRHMQGQTRLRQLEALAKSDSLLEACSTELEELELWLQRILACNGSMFGALKWTLQEKDITRRLHAISRLKSTLQLGLSLDNTQLLLESHLATLSLSQSMGQTQDDQHQRTIMEWLTAHLPKPSIPPNAGKRATGNWFLNGSSFKEWRSSPQSIL